ncbi:hypothetical protein [Streptomyces albidoflavus]|uniref:hypothetical protein n=1 Tax=Streptomyces albidoflavus TaxID=1886 RepID=UPI001021E2A5|nr:hypothetical protein [Streptomyces albidoflavus]RZF02797.1 hypothetical protein C0R05_31780 [Streptomyces albidoflavus]
MARTATATATAITMPTAIAPGTKVYTTGTFYEAVVVSSESYRRFIDGRPGLRSIIRWTCNVPAAGVREGEEDVWLHFPGRPPRFIVGANN